MPAFIAFLLGALGPVLQSVAGRVLLMLGIGIVTFTGVNVALDGFKADVLANLAGLPPLVLDVLSLARVDQAVLTVFSAYAGAFALRGVSGAVSRWVIK